MNSLTAADLARVTYRQLDHWIRKGYIHGANPGSGYSRDLTGHEVLVLRHMSALVHAGMTATEAAPIARRLASGEAVSFGPWQLSPVRSDELDAHLRALEETA